jgi:hypothetical protein
MAPAAAAGSCLSASKVAFVLAGPGAAGLPSPMTAEGFCVQLYATEGALLLAWRSWLQLQDPDGIVVFQVMIEPSQVIHRSFQFHFHFAP